MPSTSYQLRSGNQRSQPALRQRQRNSIANTPQMQVSITKMVCAVRAECGQNIT